MLGAYPILAIMKKTLFITCVLLLIIAGYSKAKQTPIDSLENLLQTISANEKPGIGEKKDTLIVNILNKLSLAYLKEDPLKAFRCANQGLALAVKIKYREGLSASYNNLGFIFKSLGDNINTLKYFHKSVEIKEEVLTRVKFGKNSDNRWKVKQEIADSYNNIGLLYENIGEYPDAFNYFFRSLSIRKELLDQTMLSENPATSSEIEKLKIYNMKQDLASCNNNIGVIYIKQATVSREEIDTTQANQDYSTASRMFFESLNINEEIGDKHGIAHSYNYIGLVYYNKGNLSREKGNTAQANRDYSIALKNYFESLNINKEPEDKAGITDTYINIGLVYTKIGKYRDAIEYIKKGLAIAVKTGLKKRIKAAYRELVNINDTLGNYEKAYQYHKLYSAINDTLIKEERGLELNSVEVKHKFKIEKKNMKMKAEAEAIVEEKKEKRSNFIWKTGLLISVVLFFAVTFIFFRLLIPVSLAQGIIFFVFIMIYVFIMEKIDPYVESFTDGESGYKIAINVLVAVIMFPLYHLLIGYIKPGEKQDTKDKGKRYLQEIWKDEK